MTFTACPNAESKRSTASLVVNDVHSRLNATSIKRLLRPKSLVQLVGGVKAASVQRRSLSIAATRHAMGGQQFLQDGLLLEMAALNRVITFDPEAGTITVEAGMDWPGLQSALERLQPDYFAWTFRQKQTGADHLSMGGALAANIQWTRPAVSAVQGLSMKSRRRRNGGRL